MVGVPPPNSHSVLFSLKRLRHKRDPDSLEWCVFWLKGIYKLYILVKNNVLLGDYLAVWKLFRVWLGLIPEREYNRH